MKTVDEDKIIITAFENNESKAYVELFVEDDKMLIKTFTEVNEIKSKRYANRTKVLLVLENLKNSYLLQGYTEVEPKAMAYWSEIFIRNLAKIEKLQKSEENPCCAAYAVEWTIPLIKTGKSSMRVTAHRCKNQSDTDNNSSINTFINEDVFSGPKIDNNLMFETIVSRVIKSTAFKKLEKQVPFRFTYEKYDASYMHTIKV